MAAVETPSVIPPAPTQPTPAPTQRIPAANITEDFVYRLAKLEAAQELRHSQLLAKVDQQTAIFKSMVTWLTRIFETLQADSNDDDVNEENQKKGGDEEINEYDEINAEINGYADENCIPSDLDNFRATTAEPEERRSLTVDTTAQHAHSQRQQKAMSARATRPSRPKTSRTPRRSMPANFRQTSASLLDSEDMPPNTPITLRRAQSQPDYVDDPRKNSPNMTRRASNDYESDEAYSRSSGSLRQSQNPRAHNKAPKDRSKTPRSKQHRLSKESGNSRPREKTPRNVHSGKDTGTGPSPLASSSKRSPRRTFKGVTRTVMAMNRFQQTADAPHLMEPAAVQQYKMGEVKITIPQGATSETVLRCRWDGTSFRCHIPPGKGPGDKFLVKVS